MLHFSVSLTQVTVADVSPLNQLMTVMHVQSAHQLVRLKSSIYCCCNEIFISPAFDACVWGDAVQILQNFRHQKTLGYHIALFV